MAFKIKQKKSVIDKKYFFEPTKLQLTENAIRDMFLSRQYNQKVPTKDIKIILKSKRWENIYGKGNVKKAWDGLVKDGYARKKGDYWVWGL
jgi:hypothetical protein